MLRKQATCSVEFLKICTFKLRNKKYFLMWMMDWDGLNLIYEQNSEQIEHLEMLLEF